MSAIGLRWTLVRMWDGQRHRQHHAWVTLMTREGYQRCLEAHRGAWNCQPATGIMHEPGATVKWWVGGKTWNDVLTLDRLRFCSGPWDAVIQELTSIPRWVLPYRAKCRQPGGQARVEQRAHRRWDVVPRGARPW